MNEQEDRFVRILVDRYDYRLILRKLGSGKIEFSVDYPNATRPPDRAELDPDDVIDAVWSLKREMP